jgi:hypothetical protein
MRLVALDLGTTSACVVLDPGLPPIVAEWDCSVRRGESNGARFLRFRRYLAQTLDDAPPIHKMLGYERPGVLKSGPAYAVLYGLVAEVEAACTERGIEYVGFRPSELKKLALGKGGGPGTDKKAMVAAANLRWPTLPLKMTHNLADALFVMELLKVEANS